MSNSDYSYTQGRADHMAYMKSLRQRQSIGYRLRNRLAEFAAKVRSTIMGRGGG